MAARGKSKDSEKLKKSQTLKELFAGEIYYAQERIKPHFKEVCDARISSFFFHPLVLLNSSALTRLRSDCPLQLKGVSRQADTTTSATGIPTIIPLFSLLSSIAGMGSRVMIYCH